MKKKEKDRLKQPNNKQHKKSTDLHSKTSNETIVHENHSSSKQRLHTNQKLLSPHEKYKVFTYRQ